jgi:(p)ppGpp synthase/HD superfamily hydrolase
MAAALTYQTARGDAVRHFVADAYDGVRVRPGKGLPHAEAVADILRRAGGDEATVAVALLHDVVEDTPLTVNDVRSRFGEPTARLVDALTEDTSIRHYAARKRALRSRIVAAGPPAVDVSLADKIASLREAEQAGSGTSRRTLSHYRATLQLALAAEMAPSLCRQLQDLLATATVR